MTRLKEWLKLFQEHRQMKIFHFQHLRLFTGKSNHALRIALKRLTDHKVIQRICRNYYANPVNRPSLEEVSAVIYKPSYISLESALSQYGILSQMPYTLTCVTTQLPKIFKTSFGDIRYRQIQQKHFRGFLQKNGCYIAEPEKAVADYLYFNQKQASQGILPEFKMDFLKPKKLKAYAAAMLKAGGVI